MDRGNAEDAASEDVEDTTPRNREGQRKGHVAAKYKRMDEWLEKIGYRKDRKSSQD